MQDIRYHDVLFDGDRLHALRDNGVALRFTRNERALLLHFQNNPRRLLTRADLLEAMGMSEHVSERVVDFTINRLRVKLGDDARDPRFVATQYGEGYLWVADAATGGELDAFLVIGPDYAHMSADAHGYMKVLRDVLAGGMSPGCGVVLATQDPSRAAWGRRVRYVLEAGMHLEGNRLHGAFALYDARGSRLVTALHAETEVCAWTGSAITMGESLREALRADQADHARRRGDDPVAAPYYISLHETGLRMARSAPEALHEAERRLARLRGVRPHDPALMLEWAALRSSQRLLGMGRDGMLESPRREADEREIVSLCLAALPALQGEPMLMLTAAKVLLLCGQAYFGLVERIVDDVLERSTAQTAALAVRAQLHMYRGDIGQALALYERCLQVAEPGGEFQVYLLVLKGKALLSAGDSDATCRVAAELHAVKPETRCMTGIQSVPADAALPADLALHLRALGRDGARALVAHCWYFSGRLFLETGRRFNVMRNVVAHAVAAFGGDVVPDAVLAAVPALAHCRAQAQLEA